MEKCVGVGVLHQDEVCENGNKLASFVCVLQVIIRKKANQSWLRQ